MLRPLAALPLLLPSLAFAQNLVANGGFEQPPVSSPWVQRLPAEIFGGWTVDDVGQGIVQVASFGRPAAVEGAQCLELNFYVPCGVSQTLTTIAGARYTVAFKMAGQTDVGPEVKEMRVDWAGAPLATVSWNRAVQGSAWTSHTLSAVAAGTSTTLHFFGLTVGDGGPYLDEVSVTLTPGCAADIGTVGGQPGSDGALNNNDFIVFIDLFFASSPQADIGVTGGAPGSDGLFDNNDFIVYIDRFFTGC